MGGEVKGRTGKECKKWVLSTSTSLTKFVEAAKAEEAKAVSVATSSKPEPVPHLG